MDDKKTVLQSNTITSARYDYNATQLDILFMLLSKISDNDPADKEYLIDMKECGIITGRTYNYTQIRDNLRTLGGRTFEIDISDEQILQLWLFRWINYYHKKSILGVVINEQARDLFIKLKNNYTVIPLKSMLSLNSKYSKRIYALALQWKTVGQKTYDISELKYMLGCENQYDVITIFKDRVLEVAKNEINDKTDMQFDYKLIKEGRSYTKVMIKLYKVKKSDMREIDIHKDSKLQIKEIQFNKRYKEIKQLDINDDFAQILAKPQNYAEFIKAKEQVLQEIKKGKLIDDKIKYLIGIMQIKKILPKK